MRISDWSSDVCSSDLLGQIAPLHLVVEIVGAAQGKALFDFLIWADREDVLIDFERDAAEALVMRLSLYRLLPPITIDRKTLVLGTRLSVLVYFCCCRFF